MFRLQSCSEDDTILVVKSLVNTTFGIAYAAPVGAGAVF